jgi:hypothetical protein
VASRLGLQAPSFALAAENYADAVGSPMSTSSLRRVTQATGAQMEAHRQAVVEQVYARPEPGGRADQPRVPPAAAIAGPANLSTDGGMVLIRAEGWKEVKLTTVSAVAITAPVSPPPPEAADSRRSQDPTVQLHSHSYQAGLWDADEMERHQYVEGLRRDLEHKPTLTSVNDGAPWITRITRTNFPQAVQITDWRHSQSRLWTVAHAVFKEPAAAQTWAITQLDRLWEGDVHLVVKALQGLSLDETMPDLVRQSPEYFHTRQAQMAYADFRQQGYPIGSGTVESGIDNVVHHRMKRPGRGWARKSAQQMLAGLSELHSGRFEQAWQALHASPS